MTDEESMDSWVSPPLPVVVSTTTHSFYPTIRLVDPTGRTKLTFHPALSPVDRRPRRVGPEAHEATCTVSHAIDYLADSRTLPNGKLSDLNPEHPDSLALLLLLEARLQIYLDCPVIERRSLNPIPGLFTGKDRRRPG